MTPYRLLVTGSRDWTNREIVNEALRKHAAAAYYQDRPLVVVHGAAPGADTLAAEWVAGAQGAGWPVDHEPHRVTGREWSESRQAGHFRNQRMVDAGADACVAFLMPCIKPGCKKFRGAPHDSHGASDCAARALGAGIPTTPYGPDGQKG